MAFFDIDNFWGGGFNPEWQANGEALDETNARFGAAEKAAREAWEATPPTQAAWGLKAPEAVIEPSSKLEDHYLHRIGESKDDPKRWEEARASQAAKMAAWEAYKAAKAAYEADKAALLLVAKATPEWQAYQTLLAEKEAWKTARRLELYAKYKQEVADGLHA